MTPDQRTSAFRPDAKTSKEQRKQPKIDLVRVISRAENGTLLGYVPLDLIYEDVPVDDRRVNELADDIERREQREPIVIGYVRDRNRLAIMNGFHRVAAMKELGKDEIFSTIWPDVTWKDVLEHRILATKNQAIQFARLPEWLHELFHEEQKWVKMGITLNQVFGVGNNLRRIPQEIKGEVDEWIKHVVELSGKGKVTLANMLRTANVADPDLMKRSRTGGVGKNKAEGKLNQRKLDAIAAELPYESNFWRQRFVANKALDFNLSLKEISDLSIQMRDVDDLVEAREVFEAFMIEKGLDAVFDTEETPDVPTVRKNGDGKIQPVKPIEEVSVFDARAEKHRDEKLLDLLLEAELRATHEMIKNAAFLGKINPDHVPAAPFIYEQLPPNQVDELLSTLFLEENDEREVDNNGYPGYSANFLGEA
ncbi:MAG: ParB N-terminal domain-containing protein, partial [Actinobacteria bacterium]|nr:ParB N-terminal domain-containing protein [Actinomycetota bacterium]